VKRAGWLVAVLALAACEEEKKPVCVVDPSATHLPCLPPGSMVMLGELPVRVIEWTPNHIRILVPPDAPSGPQELRVFLGKQQIGALDFEVISKKDISGFDEKAVLLDPDEKAYVEAILAELKNIAQRDKVPELDEFAHKIEQLLEKAENGEITKDQLLEALSKAEDAMKQGEEPNQAEIDKQMAEMGKELKKSDVTKELGQALEKNDLPKAKEELEKLAEKLAKKELTDKQKEDLQKQLEKVAEQMEKQDKQQQDKQQQQQEKLQQEIRRLEKQKDEAKTEKQKQDAERRLEEKKRELQKLQKEQEKKDQSEQRRAVKRLQKNLEKAAENLQKPQKDPNQQNKDDQQDGEQQASEKLKDAARETGKVDQDQRKQAAQKKTSTQMDDLREAMRRAKQRGNKGPNDPFNKQGKNQDFISRARGQQGSKGAWKPGQGQGGQGQGQGQGQGGQGQGSGGQGSGSAQGSGWGTGHDDNIAGDPTGKSGNVRDQDLQGQQGNEGGSTRETILAAAQKGFASKRYQKVYQDYQRIVEEVMRTEKLPSSYKYYVKRYFAKIHPSMSAPPATGPATGEGTKK
jgi:chemotaxis protein histidine kinase CheA